MTVEPSHTAALVVGDKILHNHYFHEVAKIDEDGTVWVRTINPMEPFFRPSELILSVPVFKETAVA